MSKLGMLAAPVGVLLVGAAFADTPKAPAPEQMGTHVMLVPTELKWGEGPPGLPKGAKATVLEGDPSKAGPFTIRAELPPGYQIKPHWHPAIEHVTVISAEQSQPLADRNVLIRDGRIVSVGQQAVAAKADTRKIDGRGKFLTPGLMDSHVHASDSAGIPPIGDDPALVALRDAYQRQQPRSYLYFGVTQLLDLFQLPGGLKTNQG